MNFPTANEYAPRKVSAVLGVFGGVVHILGDYVDDMAIKRRVFETVQAFLTKVKPK